MAFVSETERQLIDLVISKPMPSTAIILGGLAIAMFIGRIFVKIFYYILH